MSEALRKPDRECPWPFYGFAPGGYSITCGDCGETFEECDKRALRCLNCAVLAAKAIDAGRKPEALKTVDRVLSSKEAEFHLGGDMMALFRNQLLLCMLDRLGGNLEISAAEVDKSGQFTMSMKVDQPNGIFHLDLGRKS